MANFFKLTKTILKLSSMVIMLTTFAFAPVAVNAAGKPLPQGHSNTTVCARGGLVAHCYARVVTESSGGKPLATIAYTSGFAPADLHGAYNLLTLPAGGSLFAPNGQTIAAVDAYDNPNTADDLLAYRKQFNLPLCTTTAVTPTTNDLIGCLFTKVNQNGQSSPLPAGNTGWGQEIDLDVQMASAVCPQCQILLIEANSNSFSDLGASVDRAATMGVNAISNSYGGSEFLSETSSTYDGHYKHPGIAVTVSSGDSGYGVEFPAASKFVTAVGGTSLTKDTSVRGWSESAWSGAGSGCSAYISKPAWQPTIGGCSRRTVADVSAVADPNTGVAVYDSYGSTGGANWLVFGGTSVAAPIIAAVYALAGNAGGTSPAITYGEYPYSHTANIFDITSGSNGRCASRRTSLKAALCNAVTGYDGPTGLGTPNGIAAF